MDPILSLAISLERNSGVYALLLGSGVSRSAGIPTGYEVILDLIGQVAQMQKADVSPADRESWFRETTGREPEYGLLLDALAKSPAERSQLLRPYFEPTVEEREAGQKIPTAAHHAAAELVEGGFVRVIVTTNFDRLMEQALEARGIVPTVIASADAVLGARPLAHSVCTIIKVHGDYVDTRILNTSEELEAYSPQMDRLLDQVADEYGLLVCGWSSDWDPALRRVLERCASHRFTTYWAARGEPSEAAKQLIQLRRAELISIEGADPFLSRIAEMIVALREMRRADPISTAVAVQTIKRYLPETRHRVRLHDLVMDEVVNLEETISEANFPPGAPFSKDDFLVRVQRYEAATATLRELLLAGAYFGERDHHSLWRTVLERVVAGTVTPQGGVGAYLGLRRYPALLLFYAVGLGATAAARMDTLAMLFEGIVVTKDERKRVPLPQILSWTDVFTSEQVTRMLPGMERTPVSDHLHALFTTSLRPYAGNLTRYDEVFNRFEYLNFLVYADQAIRLERNAWGPIGRFAWQHSPVFTPDVVDREIEERWMEWAPLISGLFGGDMDRLQRVRESMKEFLGRVRLEWR